MTAFVAGSFGIIQHVIVEPPVGFALADHLAAADDGVVEVGALLRGQHRQRRAPRFAQQVDFFLVEAFAQVVGHGDGVGDGLIERQGFIGVEGGVGFAGTPLIPTDEDEIAR